MEEFKLKWETLDGGEYVSEWMTGQSARRRFDAKRKDLHNEIVWCELIYSPLGENAPDEEQVIDSFERRKIEILGAIILVPGK